MVYINHISMYFVLVFLYNIILSFTTTLLWVIMMMIIEKQATAKTENRAFKRTQGFPQTIKVAGTLVAEIISINEVDEDGAVKPLYDESNIAITLSATSAPLKIDSPITLQFVKPITANVVGVQLVE